MKFLTSAVTTIALLFAGPSIASQQADAPAPAAAEATAAPAKVAKPALWVVKDADTTIYLFGTIHVLSSELHWFDGPVKAAFSSSDEVVTELGTPPDPASVQGILAKYGLNLTGPALTEQLPEDKRAAFIKLMGEMGVPSEAYERFKPWLGAVQITMVGLHKAGFTAESGAESVLNNLIAEQKKPLIGLETIEQQFSYFNSVSNESQLLFLTQSLDGIEDVKTEFAKMVDTWAKGDAEGLAAIMNEGMDASPDLRKILLTDRNSRWADWIKQRLEKPGTVFIAVGAGHLSGHDSVQNQLAERQVKSTRIQY